MGIARDGNAPVPDPVRFPDARTRLQQRVRAVGKSTTIDVGFRIEGSAVKFGNGTSNESKDNIAVSTNGKNVVLDATFQLAAGKPAPDRFRVIGTFQDRNSSDSFETRWSVAVLKAAVAALAPAAETPKRKRSKKATKKRAPSRTKRSTHKTGGTRKGRRKTGTTKRRAKRKSAKRATKARRS